MKERIDLCATIDYETEGYYDCGNECDPICRCYTITDVKMRITQNFNKNFVHSQYADHFKIEKWQFIENHCLSRILQTYRFEEIENYEWSARFFYYGQEVEYIAHKEDRTIQRQIQKMLDLATDKEKIDYVLELEYGELLPYFNDKEYQLEVWNTSDLQNKNQRKRIDTTNYKPMLEEDIMAIIRPDKTILDGHHRIFSQQPNKQVPVLVAYKQGYRRKIPIRNPNCLTTKKQLLELELQTRKRPNPYDIIYACQQKKYTAKEAQQLIENAKGKKTKAQLKYYVNHYY